MDYTNKEYKQPRGVCPVCGRLTWLDEKGRINAQHIFLIQDKGLRGEECDGAGMLPSNTPPSDRFTWEAGDVVWEEK